MTTCPKCGYLGSGDAVYCGECGARLLGQVGAKSEGAQIYPAGYVAEALAYPTGDKSLREVVTSPLPGLVSSPLPTEHVEGLQIDQLSTSRLEPTPHQSILPSEQGKEEEGKEAMTSNADLAAQVSTAQNNVQRPSAGSTALDDHRSGQSQGSEPPGNKQHQSSTRASSRPIEVPYRSAHDKAAQRDRPLKEIARSSAPPASAKTAFDPSKPWTRAHLKSVFDPGTPKAPAKSASTHESKKPVTASAPSDSPPGNVAAAPLPPNDSVAGNTDVATLPPSDPAASEPTQPLATAEGSEPRELFRKIAAEPMRTICDFMIELTLGEPSRDWIGVITPVATLLRKSAEELELTELARAFDQFIQTVEQAARSSEPTVDGETKARLLKAYEQLSALMPAVFQLDGERARREPVIMLSLLRRVPGMTKVALDKLHAAGLTSLEWYFMATPQDIVDMAGVTLELASGITQRIQGYKRDVSQLSPASNRTKELKQLSILLDRLKSENARFEDALRDWSAQGKELKRTLRHKRGETVLEMNVLLARLGKVDLVTHLERLPFVEKIAEMERYLKESRAPLPHKAQASSGAKA